MPLHPTQRLSGGRFVLLGLLKAGGEAEVWRALDTGRGEERALKAYPAGDGGAEAAARELALARRLAHAHVVRVEDAFVEGDHAFVVMELAEGSLADRVATMGPLTPAEAVAALDGPLQALAEAHAQGIVHRDLKPHNLLVFGELGGHFGEGGTATVKLADFGIAQLRAEGVTRTRSGALLGSLPFMSPEQRRDPKRVGPATDVYAAAVTLAWLLLGEAPDEPWTEDAQRVLRARGVPEGMVEVIARAGARRVEERFGDAGELSGALSPVGEGVELQGDFGSGRAPAPLPVPALPRGAGRWGVGGLVLAGVVLGAGVSLIGGVFALWDDVRNGSVAESLSVRQARELAAIPACADTPTRWERRGWPRWSTSVPGGREAGGGSAADIDGDGHKDLLFVHALEEEFRIYWGTGSDFDDTPTRVPARRMGWGVPRIGDAGDIDGDGDIDLVGVAVEDRGFVIARNEGGRDFGRISTVDSGEVPAEIRVVDWDADGLADLVFTTVIDGHRRLRWRRSRTDGTFGATLDLAGVVNAFDVEMDAQGRPVAIQYLNDGALYRAARRRDGRLSQAERLSETPLAEANMLRVAAGGTAYVWDFAQRVATGLRLSTGGDSGRTTACSFPMVGKGELTDIVDIDGDDVEDVVGLMTCSYCTSSYRLYLGAR